MNTIKEIERINKEEVLQNVSLQGSWHWKFRKDPYVFVGGFPYELTEGDILVVFSQVGEIDDINFIRDKVTGKPKGFCFIRYEDWRSTVLAVDNFNGVQLLGRTLKVDHAKDYTPEEDEEGNLVETMPDEARRTPTPPPPDQPAVSFDQLPIKTAEGEVIHVKSREHKMKKHKKKHKHKKKKKKKLEEETKQPVVSAKEAAALRAVEAAFSAARNVTLGLAPSAVMEEETREKVKKPEEEKKKDHRRRHSRSRERRHGRSRSRSPRRRRRRY